MGNEQPHRTLGRMRILPQVWGSCVPPDLLSSVMAELGSGREKIFVCMEEYPSTPYLS
jgi:hypothetical protein